MFKKKLLVVLSLILVAAFALSACGGAAPAEEVVEEQAEEVVVEEVEEAEEERLSGPMRNTRNQSPGLMVMSSTRKLLCTCSPFWTTKLTLPSTKWKLPTMYASQTLVLITPGV